MLLTEHLNDGAPRLGVQIEGPICPNRSPVRHHAHGGTDLSAKDHVMILPRNFGSILLPCVWPPTTSADIKGGLFHLPHKGHIAFRIPRVKSTPDDRLDIVEAGDSTDSPKNARLEDQRALRVPVALDDPNPEVRQRLQKPSGPAAVGEVIQRQVAGSNPEVEPLPFGILSDANPAIKMCAIILMDGVAMDAAEPTVGVRQPLQLRVLRPELCVSAVTWQKVPTRALCSLTPTCVSWWRSGGSTSHIAPPDMNSYIKKYEFISPVT